MSTNSIVDFLFCKVKQILFDQTSLLKSGIGAVLVDGAEATGGDIQTEGLLEFGNVDTLFLKIWVTTNLATRVELRGASAVRVSSSDDGTNFGYFADFCHESSRVTSYHGIIVKSRFRIYELRFRNSLTIPLLNLKS